MRAHPENTTNIEKKKLKINPKNHQKLMFLYSLEPRDHQNRIRDVDKPAHANYELRRCQERRVMTILRQNRYLRIQGRMQIFRFFIVFRVFECLIDELLAI